LRAYPKVQVIEKGINYFYSVRPECSLKQSVKECIEGYKYH